MKKILSILLLGLFAFSSCGDSESEPDVPACIDNLAAELRPDFCETADLTRWDFNGRKVYCFFYGNCTDNKAVIYEEDCSEICTLFGLSQNTICEGVIFDNTATNRELIYTF